METPKSRPAKQPETYGFGFELPRKINTDEPRLGRSAGNGLPKFPGERAPKKKG